ncbi:hypothetical protein [Georgenia sp. SYP-B2076]|uniref:hypothetical protein n=1 Tax=Georgenia sp. SYP-B2076 TaxID=2495881 RepID=UPI000F8E9966|nr:hypothetical protein [Georgenia sp. SYP-B2076]
MRRHQLVQWILLPGGLTEDGMLAASVFVAPRLRPEAPATLADFPDLADWRSVLDGLTLTLERADGGTEAPQHVAVGAEGRLWGALFPPATTVRAFAFADLADRPLISYPLRDVHAHLRGQWAALALDARDDLPVTSRNASPWGPPPQGADTDRRTLAGRFGELRAVANRGVFEGATDEGELTDRLRAALGGAAERARQLRQEHRTADPGLIRPFGPSTGPGQPTGTAEAFYALAGFHARPPAEDPRDFPADRATARTELERRLDFHHHLSALGDHPAALRRLGLVIDLVIRPDFVPQTVDGAPGTLLRLRVERPSAFPPRGQDPDLWNADVTPWTECRLTQIDGQAFFTAVERTAREDFAHGFLHLDPARFEPVGVDVDGLALKALGMAATLQRQDTAEQRPLDEPDRDGVPAARTGGIAVVHAGHAQELHEDLYQARRNNDALEADPDDPPVLAAEDLVRGYRMDVLTDGTWRSLHARHVTYVPGRDPEQAFVTEDEGAVQLSLTGEADTTERPADPDGALYAHEALVTWDGWSLAVPRPGRPVEQEPAPPAADLDVGTTRLSITATAVPGSLPRLRFQARYRLRLRTVDLAGNSHSPAVADGLSQTLEGTGLPRYVHAAPAAPLDHRRFEPVPPPELVPRHPFGPGEGLERLVVRSAPGVTAAEYAAASQGAAEPSLRFRDTCERHAAAAKASLQLVEAHGLLDDAIDAVRGLSPDDAVAATQELYAVAGRESGSFRGAPGALFVPTGVRGGDGGAAGGTAEGYVTIDADATALPYLPDPLASGVLARVTLDPGLPAVELRLPFPPGAGWHDPRPLRVVLGEGDHGAALDPDGRTLRLSLPAGRTGNLRLSSLFENDPDVFGIMGWCREELGPGDAEQVYEAIKRGTHWMTAPWRDVALVHAVQRPLEPGELDLEPDAAGVAGGPPVLQRDRGATAAQLHGRFSFDQPSTATLRLAATWAEVRDDAGVHCASAEEMVSQVTREVFSLPVPEPFGTPWIPEITTLIDQVDAGLVEFRTRGEWPPETRRLQLLAEAGAPGLGARERRRLEAGAAQLEQLRAHEFGDTRYRRVTYRPSAATRFREYFDPAMPAEDGMSAGQPLVLDVLSSAPPAQPSVLQVLPLLDYAQSRTDDGATSSRRSGPGLRVWLDRGWFSSGAGELLAVACTGSPITSESDLSREITLRLQDPGHASTLPQPLLAESFPGARLRVRSVPLHAAGTSPGPWVDLAAFEPVWDEGRQAWYCDVEFSSGAAYFPFVRLGLARYQPRSIPGCELSPIVPTAFVQTVPERSLSCVPGDGGAVRLSLSGPAPSAARDGGGAVVAGTNVVAAVVEAKDPRFAHPALGWAAAGAEVELTAVLGDDGTATWTGDVPVPAGGGAPLRVAVREFEVLPADGGPARRQVHADVVPLT